MTRESQIIRGLDAFSQQFQVQFESSGTPANESPVSLCLALAFQSALALPVGSVINEWHSNGHSIDIWIPSIDTGIQLTYSPPRALRTNTLPLLYGRLLAEVNNIAQVPLAARLALIVTDRSGVTYLSRRSGGLLPLGIDKTKLIGAADIRTLPPIVAGNALAYGPWTSPWITLVWRRASETWHMLCWRVDPSSISPPA